VISIVALSRLGLDQAPPRWIITRRAQFDLLAGPGQGVGALAVDLDRRIGGRDLVDLADEGGQGGRRPARASGARPSAR
jgi:hypothetical protein